MADFVASTHREMQIRSTFKEFGHLWATQDPQPHTISILYQLLDAAKSLSKPYFIRDWENDLQCEFTKEQMQQLYYLTYSSSVESKAQENNYKLLTRWYHVPTTVPFTEMYFPPYMVGVSSCPTFLGNDT